MLRVILPINNKKAYREGSAIGMHVACYSADKQ